MNIKIQNKKMLPVVFHGCKTLPAILTQGHRSRIFDSRVLRICEPSEGGRDISIKKVAF